ncbi:MAG: trypsin-like peptidase domain-containing protein, partial [Pseudonocardiaceae bacterium]
MAGTAAPNPTWIAAIHKSAEDFAPLGTAVVIDERRVLTSAHVVAASGGLRPELWVVFPMAEDPSATRRRATQVRHAAHQLADLAVVEFEEPIPDGVAAAPLRCPKPADVLDRTWRAFGFAHHDPQGN